MTNIPESQQQFGSILTLLGENAEQNGKLQNKQIMFTHIAIGDANDSYIQPNRAQTELVNEVARIPVNSVDVYQPTPDSQPLLKVEAILPDTVYDVIIREFAAVAEFNGAKYLHAVGNCARVYVPKPLNNGNVSTPVTLEMIFVITSAEPIIEIDPNVVTASREWVKQYTKQNLEASFNKTDLSSRVSFIAHRGASRGAPENTLPAYDLAGQLGFWGAECDIQLTKDEQWILMHDSTVDRTTDGSGSVSALTLAEIKTLDAGSWFDDEYAGTKVPTLTEYLHCCKRNNLVPVMEIKATSSYSVAQLNSLVNQTKSIMTNGAFTFISFSQDVIRNLRLVDKDIELQLVVGAATQSHIDFCLQIGRCMLDASSIGNLDFKGVMLNCWTINNSETARNYAAKGVKQITTDVLTRL